MTTTMTLVAFVLDALDGVMVTDSRLSRCYWIDDCYSDEPVRLVTDESAAEWSLADQCAEALDSCGVERVAVGQVTGRIYVS